MGSYIINGQEVRRILDSAAGCTADGKFYNIKTGKPLKQVMNRKYPLVNISGSRKHVRISARKALALTWGVDCGMMIENRRKGAKVSDCADQAGDVVWVPYDDCIDVSNTGLFRKRSTGNLIRPFAQGNQILVSIITETGSRKTYHADVIYAQLFTENPKNLPYAHVIDTNKGLSVDNIIWSEHDRVSIRLKHALVIDAHEWRETGYKDIYVSEDYQWLRCHEHVAKLHTYGKRSYFDIKIGNQRKLYHAERVVWSSYNLSEFNENTKLYCIDGNRSNINPDNWLRVDEAYFHKLVAKRVVQNRIGDMNIEGELQRIQDRIESLLRCQRRLLTDSYDEYYKMFESVWYGEVKQYCIDTLDYSVNKAHSETCEAFAYLLEMLGLNRMIIDELKLMICYIRKKGKMDRMFNLRRITLSDREKLALREIAERLKLIN